MPENSSSSPAGNPQNVQLSSQLSVLIVDPNPALRANLQNMLNQSGVTRIESAVNASTAIKALGRKSFDIILCEYDLGSGTTSGEGQDGQQLLEDLRHHRLIPPWSIFIMLTAEGAYGKVVSAAELTPTDYILKPFTVQVLHERIQKAVARRAALLPVYQLIAQARPREAIDAAIESARTRPHYALDFARLRAELHVSLKEHELAETVYRDVLATKPVGWARLGLARAVAAQGRTDEAIPLLEHIVAENPRLMAAYDLLARCQQERGDAALAKKTLEDAVAISPYVVRRLRRLGEVALEAGDTDGAEKSFRQVVTRSRYSEFRNPEDHVNLVRALVGKGDPAGASTVIRDLERSLRGTPAADACKAISVALLHDAAGNGAAAVKELKLAVDAVRAGGTLSPNMRVGLAQTCLAHRMDDEASEVMLGALNGGDEALSAQQALNVFVRAGRPDLADGMGKQLRAQAQILLGVADEKRNMGDVRGAVQTLLEALHMAPNNLQVMIAVVGGVLRQIMEMGWDHPLAALSEEQLEHIRALDPAHPRLAALDAEMEAAKRKYGIAN
ncbi:response regulator [Telluria mixta]|uniref:Response regulator n=1 Tax=Telluria mixta TaxID=34071 RepID=A0ABT2C8S2_9BURK|nr:tetratricopeptide repeat-containing response regulator [Telluria mixta]MCS0633764.1 response regulator [Telluria mixta]WEM95087.1 response regulator [Telluria mixta]